ncbi:MAG: LPS export ABC transporter permease LptF [Pseudomonadota bacterium]|nr:LPS export ABC transporter permease LptF [Pseudomonadota bacterium]
MRSLSRYMIRSALGPFLFVTMVLTGVIWIVQALRFVDEIINYDMTTSAFLYLTLLLLPQLLPVTMPIGLFCGMLYAYWRLSTESELVVMRAAGLSRMRLALPGLVLGCACATVVAIMTFFLMPASNSTMRDTHFAWRYIYSNLVLREGAFTPLKGQLTAYVRERRPGGELRGLLIHDERDTSKSVTMMAEHGTIVRNDAGPKILLRNGNRQERDRRSGDVSILFFENYNLELDLLSGATPVRPQKLEELDIVELFLTPPGMGEEARWRRHVEGHKRIVLPLLAIAFSLIAIAAILSGEFDRRGQGRRILIAAAGAAVVQAAALALGQAAGSTPVLLPVLYLVLATSIGLCLWMIRPGAGSRLIGGAAPAVAVSP